MPPEFEIRPVSALSAQLEPLAVEAQQEGYRFVERLIDDWKSGANRFNGTGELFFGVFCGRELVAVGGLNQDPYTNDPVGRIRHVYVLPKFRRLRIGRNLVTALANQSKSHFPRTRLRTSDQAANSFYNAIGFGDVNEPDATHEM